MITTIIEWLLWGTGILALLLVLTTVSPTFQGLLVYCHWLNFPPAWLVPMSWGKPANTKHFFITEAGTGRKIGTWLVSRSSTSDSTSTSTSTSNPKKAILYFHGNAGSRRHFRRNRCYGRLLEALDADLLLTIDPRGFGDSPGTPTELGVIQDAQMAYSYLLNTLQIPPSHIYVWGHSLGTGIATGLVSRCQSSSSSSSSSSPSSSPSSSSSSSSSDIILSTTLPAPRALFLEAPFKSIPETAADHYIGAPLRLLPAKWQQAVTNRIVHRFETEKAVLRGLPCPLMVLHSLNDAVVLVNQGRAVHQAAVQSGILTAAHFFADLGHNGISLSPLIRPPIQDFISSLPPL